MKWWWVSFEVWSPTRDNYMIAPHAWVYAEDTEHSIVRARRKLEVPDDLVATTVVEFTEEQYRAERARVRRRLAETKAYDHESLN